MNVLVYRMLLACPLIVLVGCKRPNVFEEKPVHPTIALRRSVRGADRLRIRTGGMCHRIKGMERTLTWIEGEQLVRTFTRHIDVFDGRTALIEYHSDDGTVRMVKRGSVFCGCCGTPTIEWYKGRTLLAVAVVHHGDSMVWNGSAGNQDLTEKSRKWLSRWLARRGVDLEGSRQYMEAQRQFLEAEGLTTE